MKFLVSLVALFAVGNCATCANRTNLVTKAFNLGLVKGTVCDAASAEAIMTCAEPYILKCPPYMENLTDPLVACVMSKSMKFLSPVIDLKNKMESCLGSGSSALTFLGNLLAIGKPRIQPHYVTMCSDLTKMKTAGKSADQQACYMWGFIMGKATTTLAENYCNDVAATLKPASKEWGCCKNPGNRTINFSLYPKCGVVSG